MGMGMGMAWGMGCYTRTERYFASVQKHRPPRHEYPGLAWARVRAKGEGWSHSTRGHLVRSVARARERARTRILGDERLAVSYDKYLIVQKIAQCTKRGNGAGWWKGYGAGEGGGEG